MMYRYYIVAALCPVFVQARQNDSGWGNPVVSKGQGECVIIVAICFFEQSHVPVLSLLTACFLCHSFITYGSLETDLSQQ